MAKPEYKDAEGRNFSQYVADQVHGAIIASGRSINDVAKGMGIPHSTLHDKFNGVSAFNTDLLSKVAAELGVHPAEFVKATSFVIVGDVTVDVDGDKNDIDVDIG